MPSFDDLKERYLYAIQCGPFIKIGVTVSVKDRLSVMRLYNPHKLKVVHRLKMKAAYHCERKIHEVLRPRSVGREWFEVSVEEAKAAITIGIAYAKDIRAAKAKSRSADFPVTQTQLKPTETPVISTLLDLTFLPLLEPGKNENINDSRA